MLIFAWDDWNREYIGEHRVTVAEAEYVVRHAKPPFPREIEDDKQLVWGQTEAGRYLQVVFVFRAESEVEYESLALEDILALSDQDAPVVYVVHAMELTGRMKHQYRRL